MKKSYFAPQMMKMELSTADVITLSVMNALGENDWEGINVGNDAAWQ